MKMRYMYIYIYTFTYLYIILVEDWHILPNFQTILFVPKRLETRYFRPASWQEDTNAWLARSGDEEPARNRKYAWGTKHFSRPAKMVPEVSMDIEIGLPAGCIID